MNTFTRILTYTGTYKNTFMLAGALSCLYGLFAAAPAYALQHLADNVFVTKNTGLLLPFILCFIGLFIGGLMVAGGFTFMPGRLMHEVVFG